jgi:uncharacterized protein with PQ loop repeat
MSTHNTYKYVVLITCNVINVIYHLPQIIKTYKTKSVKDFDSYYLILGNLHSFCWVLYSIEDNNSLMIFNSCVTMFSISFISYYKLYNYIEERYKKTQLNNIASISTAAINIDTINIDTNKENNIISVTTDK